MLLQRLEQHIKLKCLKRMWECECVDCPFEDQLIQVYPKMALVFQALRDTEEAGHSEDSYKALLDSIEKFKKTLD